MKYFKRLKKISNTFLASNKYFLIIYKLCIHDAMLTANCFWPTGFWKHWPEAQLPSVEKLLGTTYGGTHKVPQY